MAIFAREVTEELTSLVKKIDSESEKCDVKAFVVIHTSDVDATKEKLAAVAKEHGIKMPMTVFEGEAGPPAYKLSKEAFVTVLTWKKRAIQSNHAYSESKDLNDKTIEACVSAVAAMK